MLTSGASGLLAANPYGAAIGAAAGVAQAALAGGAASSTGQVSQGGNITFGASDKNAWMMPAAILAAVLVYVAATKKRKG